MTIIFNRTINDTTIKTLRSITKSKENDILKNKFAKQSHTAKPKRNIEIQKFCFYFQPKFECTSSYVAFAIFIIKIFSYHMLSTLFF